MHIGLHHRASAKCLTRMCMTLLRLGRGSGDRRQGTTGKSVAQEKQRNQDLSVLWALGEGRLLNMTMKKKYNTGMG